MIIPEQLFEKFNVNKLFIYFENTETIIAEIDKDRTVILSKEFEKSLTSESINKIYHIAKYFDDGWFIPISVENNNNIDIPMEAKFQRFMNERPIINNNDLCKVFGRIDTDFTSIYRIEYIWNLKFVKLKNTDTPNILENISIDDIVLIKEYQENLYYIQNGYVENSMCWWALNSKGYTTDITKAHKFTEKEMLSIIENNKYRAWKCDYIDNQKNAHIMIIDSQYFDADWNENVIN